MSSLPPLPTTVIGSYSMPAWLERAKNDFLQRKVSRHDLDDMYDSARKAAVKDQEVAGIDIISDGELHRDNMIDYFAERIPGVQVDHGSKRLYYDFYDSVVRSKLATGRSACSTRRASCAGSPSGRRRFQFPGRTRWSNGYATTSTRRKRRSRSTWRG